MLCYQCQFFPILSYPPKVENCPKSVFSRPPHSPKVKIIQNESFLDHHTLPKSYHQKPLILRTLHPSKVETARNQSLYDHHTNSKTSIPEDLSNECALSSLVWLMNPFQDHLWYPIVALSHERPEQWTCRGFICVTTHKQLFSRQSSKENYCID